MDISRYIKVLDEVERKLKKGDLDLQSISGYVEKRLGIKFKDSHIVKDDIEDQIKRCDFEQKYNPLYSKFVELITIMDQMLKRPDPFSFKHNSSKIYKGFEFLKKYKEDDNYEVVFLEVLDHIANYMPEINITKEHLAVFKRKYL